MFVTSWPGNSKVLIVAERGTGNVTYWDTSTPGDCSAEARVQGISVSSDLGQLMVVDVGASPPIAWSYASGLRNPFGFSVDRGDATTMAGRGDVWIGDVGGSNTGSIMRWIPTGLFRNFGWPWYMGSPGQMWGFPPALAPTPCGMQPYNPPNSCGVPPGWGPPELPFSVCSDVAEYGGAHDALIGGYVYRNNTVLPLQDRYVFATYGIWGPRVYSLPVTGAPGAAPINHTSALGIGAWSPGHFIHGMGQDHTGEVYIIRVDQALSQLNNGSIFQVTP
ncbi:MAG: hypothetical protein R3F49_24270 [Planctomycetota bacterium]